MNFTSYVGQVLPGGFVITDIQACDDRLLDAIGREAVAQTTITGRHLRLVVWAGLSERELSITLYHEVLEAAAVACDHPPARLAAFNEADFERAAQEMHATLGQVSAANLRRTLEHFGF